MLSSKEKKEIQSLVMSILDDTAKLARDESGGLTRLLYSDEWVKTQSTLEKIMSENGLKTRYDEIGNLYGRLESVEDLKETVMVGSHVDTVVNGGDYDGIYGITAGILALDYLKKKFGAPKRALEVISFAEEEGSRFPTVFWGSKNFVGLEDRGAVEGIVDAKGDRFTEAMQGAGFGFKAKPNSARDDIKYFVETHIEQGSVLEKEELTIGIVDNIVGQRRFSIEVKGVANHAGTTPMSYRKDAFFAASAMVVKILNCAVEYGDPLVATVGSIELTPNTVNVVPGNAVFSLDIRHVDSDVLKQFTGEVLEILKETAEEKQVEVTHEMWMDTSPVPLSSELVAQVKEICQKQKLPHKVMPSGAGHDSQVVATKIPTVLIFVPSKEGISHNPKEYTAPEFLTEGVSVVIETLYALAYE